MNSLTIAGNVAREAEIKYLPNGDAVCNFSVADNQGKDKPAIFWNCQLFGKRAESLSQYITKGQSVTVSGTLTEREWTDKDGNKRKQMDLRVNDVALQGGRKESSEPAQAPQRKAQPQQQGSASSQNNFSDMDDDIPFLFNICTVCDIMGTSKQLLRAKHGKGMHLLQANKEDC